MDVPLPSCETLRPWARRDAVRIGRGQTHLIHTAANVRGVVQPPTGLERSPQVIAIRWQVVWILGRIVERSKEIEKNRVGGRPECDLVSLCLPSIDLRDDLENWSPIHLTNQM